MSHIHPDGVRRRAPADDRDARVVTRDAEVVAAPERSGLDPLVLGKVEEQLQGKGAKPTPGALRRLSSPRLSPSSFTYCGSSSNGAIPPTPSLSANPAKTLARGLS